MNRTIEEKIKGHFLHYKQVLVLLGTRQVGKTTLVRRLFPDAVYLLVDNEPVRRILEAYDIESYKILIPVGAKQVIIDEAHLLKDPGRAVKVLYDQSPGLQIIITGSSSFHIRNKTAESLAGRKIDYFLYPLTFAEMLYQRGIEQQLPTSYLAKICDKDWTGEKESLCRFDLDVILADVLLFGMFPFLVTHPHDRKFLENFVDSLVFKDIVELNLIENKRLARDLLKLLAHQIGNIINYSELAASLGADQRSIKRYIEIFEQSYILFRLYPYAKNKRKEIVKSPKIYFCDTGIRNALIGDFSPLATRTDKGALFENFLLVELMKQNAYYDWGWNFYYWRTKQGAEMDVVLERTGELLGIEVKMQRKTLNRTFATHYPEVRLRLVTSRNFY